MIELELKKGFTREIGDRPRKIEGGTKAQIVGLELSPRPISGILASCLMKDPDDGKWFVQHCCLSFFTETEWTYALKEKPFYKKVKSLIENSNTEEALKMIKTSAASTKFGL